MPLKIQRQSKIEEWLQEGFKTKMLARYTMESNELQKARYGWARCYDCSRKSGEGKA